MFVNYWSRSRKTSLINYRYKISKRKFKRDAVIHVVPEPHSLAILIKYLLEPIEAWV